MSPVLESFLAGNQQQTSLLKAAQEIMDRRANQQNQIEERKQKQQEIDNIMKRFDTSSKLEQQRVDLEHQNATDTHNLHLMTARQNFQSNLASGIEAPQQSMQSPGINIPGLPQVNPSDGSQTPTPGMVLPGGAPQMQNNAIQTIDTPMGKISVPMPQTNLQQLVAQRAVTDPLDIAKKKQEGEDDANAKMPAMNAKLDQMRDTMDSRERMNDLKTEIIRQGNEGRLAAAEARHNQATQDMLFKLGVPMDPGERNKVIASYVHQQASGQGSGNPRQEYGPVMGGLVEQGLQAAGFRTPPKGLREAVTGMADDASKFLGTIDNIKATAKPPTTKTGQISNYLADKFGVQGMSAYKSQFDALSTSIVPTLDMAIGLPPGSIARSPKLYDKFRSLAPLPGDKPDEVAKKEANGVDIYLSGISKKLAGLPAPQRATFWQDIANDHPELINRNPSIRKKLIEAGNSGNYTPGELWKTFGGN